MLIADGKGDYAFLSLKGPAFDLTDRGVAGRAVTANLDAFVYAERGVYRSGETVHLTTLLRDSLGAAVTGVPMTLVIERPDGTRVQFMPFPTPWFDADGNFAGAINLLLDVTCQRQVETLRNQAARCRRLAAGIGDRQAIEVLSAMAVEYDAQADRISTPN